MQREDFGKSLRYDKFLMQILDTNQGFEGYFDAVLGVLGRSTDFFSREGMAKDIINAAMRKHIKQFNDNTMVQKALADK